MGFAVISLAAVGMASGVSAGFKSGGGFGGFNSPFPSPGVQPFTPVEKHETRENSASCKVTISSETSSQAESGFAYASAEIVKRFCGKSDPFDDDEMKARVSAIAELVIKSRIECVAKGNAAACGSTWGGAETYAGAAYAAFASAYANLKNSEDCSCDVDVSVESYADIYDAGEIWAGIWAALDDKACAKSGYFDIYDFYDDEVDRKKVTDCTATVILDFTASALAAGWTRGKCHYNNPAACSECCVDAFGKIINGCDCDDWTAKCMETVKNKANTVIESKIDYNIVANEAICTTSVTNLLTGYTKDLASVYTDKNVVEPPSDKFATCTAAAEAEADSEAVSASARDAAILGKDLCEVTQYDDATPWNDGVSKIAKAVATVYNKVSAECDGENLVKGVDDACARAESSSRAIARACASAAAVALVEVSTKDCDCDVTIEGQGSAIVADFELLFAEAEQQVGAQACVFGVTRSQFERECVAEVVGLLYAKAIASIWIENGCVKPDKQWCEDNYCVDYSAYPSKDVCLSECTKDSKAKAEVFVDAVANLDLSATETCDDSTTVILGDVYANVYLNTNDLNPSP